MTLTTTKPKMFPLGRPAFVSYVIERAAHLRGDDAKLMAMESDSRARAFVVHRDSLVVAQDNGEARPLLTLNEAHGFGANPGTIFLGLRDGAAVFGMGIGSDAVEKLLTRNDVVLADIRAMVTGGGLPEKDLSTIAIAKSLINWHQRHGYCANCGARTRLMEGGWKRECPSCKVEHFPRTDPVAIMMVTDGDNCLLGRQPHFAPTMWSCLAGFVEAAETIEDAVRREVLEEAGIHCTDVRYYMSQPWPYPSSLMLGCTARATTRDITIDRTELEDARWFSRDDVRLMLKREHPDGYSGPHPFAIAHHLLGEWAKE